MSQRKTICCDLLVVGSGPAGMSAAINGASEGLSVCMIDGSSVLGGQARESNAIENYPGFPEGITGDKLMSNFVAQAIRFNTRIHCPVSAVTLELMDDNRLMVMTDDYTEYVSRTVLLSLGLSYRRLEIDGIARLMGRGVYYGLPTALANNKRKTQAVVVGGANSAGQAVLKLAENKNCHITMLIRRRIDDQMSKYLIERIRLLPNVDVCEGCESVDCIGEDRLKAVRLADGRELEADCMYIFIGAVPKTVWLKDTLDLDEKKFINTWADISDETLRKDRLPYETSIRGVFAAGDVRSGSTKRIASAIGEGAGALQMIHRHLARRGFTL